MSTIPQILHFIWLGSRLPEEYKTNILEWQRQNKNYSIKLWFDPLATDSSDLAEFCNDHGIELCESGSVLEFLPDGVAERLLKYMETTTVTKKLRRIAKLDIDELKETVMWNRPDYIVMNFINYLFPTLYEFKEEESKYQSPEFQDIHSYLGGLERTLGVPVKYGSISPFKVLNL